MSQRTRALIEVAVGIPGVFGFIWLILPLYPLWIKIAAALPILALLTVPNIINKAHRHHLGFRRHNWGKSAKILGLFTVAAIPILYGGWKTFFPVNHQFYADVDFWKRLMIYPIWALFQQYVALGYFFRRYRLIFAPYTNIAILCSAFTFSMMHIPNPSLLIFCFVSGLVWAGTYHKYSNLYTIAVSHAILGAFCLQVLWMYGTVGPDADRGRWSKKQAPVVRGEIESVNARPFDRNGQLLSINKGERPLVVEGWVATKTPVEEIVLSVGKRRYGVEIGIPHHDAAKRYQNSQYHSHGFRATIPLAEMTPGYHSLVLKVYLKNSRFYHSPGKKRWLNIQ